MDGCHGGRDSTTAALDGRSAVNHWGGDVRNKPADLVPLQSGGWSCARNPPSPKSPFRADSREIGRGTSEYHLEGRCSADGLAFWAVRWAHGSARKQPVVGLAGDRRA